MKLTCVFCFSGSISEYQFVHWFKIDLCYLLLWQHHDNSVDETQSPDSVQSSKFSHWFHEEGQLQLIFGSLVSMLHNFDCSYLELLLNISYILSKFLQKGNLATISQLGSLITCSHSQLGNKQMSGIQYLILKFIVFFACKSHCIFSLKSVS